MKSDYDENNPKRTPVFVAVCPHYWGKGYTADNAIKQARAAGATGKRTSYFSIYEIHAPWADITVDACYGDVHFPKGAKVTKLQTSSAAIKVLNA